MKVLAQLACVAFLVALVFQDGSAQTNSTSPATGKKRLECYDCSSFYKTSNCESVNDQTPTTVCEPDETMCRKVEQHIEIEGREEKRTYRSCAKTGELGKCLKRTGTKEFKSWYCQCEGSLCNSAGNTLASFTLIGGVISAAFLLKNRI